MPKYSKQEENKRNLLNSLILFTQTKRRNILKDNNLEFFSYYLSSNQDTKYNVSYFLDKILQYNLFLDSLNSKQKIYKKIRVLLFKIYKRENINFSVEIEFDNLLKYELITKIKFDLVDDISNFNISEFNNKSIQIRFIKKNNEQKILLFEDSFFEFKKLKRDSELDDIFYLIEKEFEQFLKRNK
jgi:hypothetical protein